MRSLLAFTLILLIKPSLLADGLLPASLSAEWVPVDMPTDASGSKATQVAIRINRVNGDVLIASSDSGRRDDSIGPSAGNSTDDRARLSLQNWWSPEVSNRADKIREQKMEIHSRAIAKSKGDVKRKTATKHAVVLTTFVAESNGAKFIVRGLAFDKEDAHYQFQHISRQDRNDKTLLSIGSWALRHATMQQANVADAL